MENVKNLFQRLAEVRKECNFIKKENVGSNLKREFSLLVV